MNKQHLFCPGPVHVAQNVKMAAIEKDICHRESEFSEMLGVLEHNLLRMLEINEYEKYQAILVTGSSSAANEMVISTVAQDSSVLVLTNGEFGNRLELITRNYCPNTHVLQFGWGGRVDIAQVREFLANTAVDVIIMVHHETSTGMLNPLAEVGALAAQHNCTFIVDAVSSVGAEKIDVETWNIDFITGAAGKAIAAFPGLTFIVGKVSSFEKCRQKKSPTIYLNLVRFYDYGRNLKQTPNTPSVQLFLALNQAVKNILDIGVRKYQARIAQLATQLRGVFAELGLQILITDPAQMSSVLTTVHLPAGITAEGLQQKLRERGIIIYGGKGPLKDSHFQVANIGTLSDEAVEYFITTFREVIKG